MAKQVSEETKITLDLKTIGVVIFTLATVIGMWFTLQGDIQEAKELPLPEIDRIEYDLKDELIRQTIMDTQDDVDAIRDQLDKIDERLCEIQKGR
jgi:ubiquinone biosynthesis protein UbiJ